MAEAQNVEEHIHLSPNEASTEVEVDINVSVGDALVDDNNRYPENNQEASSPLQKDEFVVNVSNSGDVGAAQDDGEDTEQSKSQNPEGPQRQKKDEDASAMGLHEQALEVIIGEHPERVGLILGLIGVATFSSGIGGYFARDTPGFLGHDLTAYYRCLPAFIFVGVIEVMYGIWVSRNYPIRANRVAKTVLLLSIIPLVLSCDFTGSGTLF